MRPSARRRLLALPLLLAPVACAAPGGYMGIDLTAADSAALASPERARAVQERNLLMLIAVLEGCYERIEGGFKPVKAAKATSFECARMLVAIEDRSAELGLGRAPSGIAAMSLASLARMASAGSKRAQLELGIRFEEGIGLEADRDKARDLYAKAATASGGTLWVYSPPVGNGTTGRVIPIDQGPRRPGLEEAKRRLEALAGHAVSAR